MILKSKYKNNKIPSKGLKKVDSGHLLEENASDSYVSMKKDAKKDGVIIDLAGDSSAYRLCGNKGDYVQGLSNGKFTQWYAWELYKAGKGNLAANPTTYKGCKSNHGWGLAIDVKGASAKKWVRENGVKYGWWWGEAPSEDWHFTYDEKKDTFLKSKKDNKKRNLNILLYTFLGLSVVGLSVAFFLVTRPKH